MEWIILLVIVPVIVVPVVLLYGFAGCTFDPSVQPGNPPAPGPPATPTDLAATATDLDRIALAWAYLDPPPDAVKFQIQRTGGSPLPQPPLVTGTTFDDTGLDEGTTYVYQVKAVRDSDGVESELSDPADATTLSFQSVFTTEGIPPSPSNGVDVNNDCIVQRITGINGSGIFVRITLRGIVNETTELTAVTISRAVPANATQPWDSEETPVPVTFNGAAGVSVANGEAAVSDKISYAVSPGQDLHVAFDVSAGSGRVLRRNVTGQVAYTGSNRAEAGTMTRTAGFNTDNGRVYCIEAIEVA